MTQAERKWVSPFYHDARRVTKARLPNLVLMVADDLAFEDLGSYGATSGLTPHADQLARSGVRFAEAHTPSPLCTPSRYSLLTGQYSSCFFAQSDAARGRHAVTRQISLRGSMSESPEVAPIDFNINLCAESAASAAGRASGAAAANAANANANANASLGAARAAPTFTAAAVAGRLPQQGDAPSEAQQSAVTLAQLLKQRGYATGFVGKWHLGYPPSNATAELRKRVVASPASAWRTVKDDVLREYRAVQAHVEQLGEQVARSGAAEAGMPAAERALVVHNGDPAGYTAAALVDALGLTDTQHDWAGRACRAVDVRQVEGALCPAELAMGRKVIFLQVALFHILGIIK